MYVGKDMAEGLAQVERIHLRRQALRTLVTRRNKQLQESLDHRIKRARRDGVGTDFTRAEWESLHQQEIAHVRGQLADFQLKMTHVREELTALKRTLGRARRLKAAQSPLAGKRK